jgi:NADPH:quinone reductase-like Zn-dependent oxidoreductase
LVVAYGYSARVGAELRLPALLLWLTRLYVSRQVRSWLPGGKRIYLYSINLMRVQHPDWFKADLGQLFGLLASGVIRPRVAERVSLDEVPDAHRRLEAGGLDGKLVLCPDRELAKP